jgi:hemerythrin-like domain-containing protein
MTATQILEAEHRLIETVVKALGGATTALEKGQHADVALLTAAVEFLRVYADKLHHGKEETLFFPMLIERGVPPQGCPIGGLKHEHEKARALVQSLAERISAYGQEKARPEEALLQALHELVDFYQNHIWKEDAMVFPMADKVLTTADQEELTAKFAEVDRTIGFDAIARLEQFARSLASIAVPSSASSTIPSDGGGCGCST